MILISHNIVVGKQNRDAFLELVRGFGETVQILDNTIVLHERDGVNVNRIQEALRTVILRGDNFILVDITGRDRNGWLPVDYWGWMRQHDIR